MIKIFMVIKQR